MGRKRQQIKETFIDFHQYLILSLQFFSTTPGLHIYVYEFCVLMKVDLVVAQADVDVEKIWCIHWSMFSVVLEMFMNWVD